MKPAQSHVPSPRASTHSVSFSSSSGVHFRRFRALWTTTCELGVRAVSQPFTFKMSQAYSAFTADPELLSRQAGYGQMTRTFSLASIGDSMSHRAAPGLFFVRAGLLDGAT